MELVEQVFGWAVKIYLGVLTVVAFWITWYGLCNPGFFSENATVLCWVGIAICLYSVGLVIVFGASYAVVYVKNRRRNRNHNNDQDSDIN